jgi:hypothetical protein
LRKLTWTNSTQLQSIHQLVFTTLFIVFLFDHSIQNRPAHQHGLARLPDLVVTVTIRELQGLAKLARLFRADPEMCAALTIAFFCCKKRNKMGTSFSKNELEEIVQYLGGRDNIPYDWCNSLFLRGDIYDPRYQDNEQMVNVMRALSNHCWGKGARARLAHRNCLLTSDAEANVDLPAEGLSSIRSESSAEPDAQKSSNSRSRNGGYGLQK